MLKRISLSFWNMWQWRKKCRQDSTSVPHLQIRFKESWKLCLYLCSRKWLRPVHSLVTSLIHLGLWQLKKLGLMNCKFFFRNVKNIFIPKIRIKKWILKKVMLYLKRCTNADLKISIYVRVHIKTISCTFRILNPKISRAIYYPWNLYFS